MGFVMWKVSFIQYARPTPVICLPLRFSRVVLCQHICILHKRVFPSFPAPAIFRPRTHVLMYFTVYRTDHHTVQPRARFDARIGDCSRTVCIHAHRNISVSVPPVCHRLCWKTKHTCYAAPWIEVSDAELWSDFCEPECSDAESEGGQDMSILLMASRGPPTVTRDSSP